MLKKLMVMIILSLSIVSLSFAQEAPSAEAIIARIKAAQSTVKDLSADTKTIITSNITLPGAVSKGPQTVTQTGHIWTKGQDKSKTELISPMHQITITNGTLRTIISPDTGRKFTQDLSNVQGAGFKDQGMDAAKALDYFDLTVTRAATNENGYLISGKPKEANKFLGRIDFFIDAEIDNAKRVAMYSPNGALIMLSDIEYVSAEGSIGVVWVPAKIKSIVTMSMGSVNTVMEYSNIKVNKGIKDSVFEVE